MNSVACKTQREGEKKQNTTREIVTPSAPIRRTIRRTSDRTSQPERREDRAVARSRSRDASIAISRRREIAILPAPLIAIDGAISRSIDREIAPAPSIARSRRRRRSRDRAVERGVFFLDLCFPSSFPNTRKYFPENFLKYNQTHENIFLFRKLAFPKNMYFPENVLQQPNTALNARFRLFCKCVCAQCAQQLLPYS